MIGCIFYIILSIIDFMHEWVKTTWLTGFALLWTNVYISSNFRDRLLVGSVTYLSETLTINDKTPSKFTCCGYELHFKKKILCASSLRIQSNLYFLITLVINMPEDTKLLAGSGTCIKFSQTWQKFEFSGHFLNCKLFFDTAFITSLNLSMLFPTSFH